LVVAALAAVAAWAAGPFTETPAQKGKRLFLSRTYSPPSFSGTAYKNAWKHWGIKERPAEKDYARLFNERYGLHPAPFPNDGLPMGLRFANGLLSKGITTDCLTCHGGSILGKSYIGLPNTAIDYTVLYAEMTGAPGFPAKEPFHFTRVRGTTEAGAMAVFLMSYRNPDLSLRLTPHDFGIHDDTLEDAPAWWLLKKKKTMYATGGGDTRSVRSLMQFMLSPLNAPSAFHKAEPDFKNIREYLLSIEAPKYPLPINRKLAAKGESLFKDNCARCHGTYGEKWTYPNKVIPLKVIGTDRKRFDGLTAKFGEHFNKSWFAHPYKGIATDGYQAPPLDGIWATAPYLHNGSVPTLYGMLNSKARPKIFTRSYRTGREDYDEKHVGWKVKTFDRAPDLKKLPALQQRKIYDTTQPGRGNGGHTFGDKFDDKERMAVIEYLKTL
jgi:mono/diheme cytochrome c family protein